MRHRAAALAATAAALVALAGCETTQQQSARIARELGHQNAATGTVKLGASNHLVRVQQTVLLSSAGQTAVAVELRNTTGTAQAQFPVLIDVLDRRGRSLYTNTTAGIDPSLQRFALLAPRASAWWVDNEVTANGAARVRVGVGAAAATAPGSLPKIATTGVSASASFPGPHVSATVTNRSPARQTQLVVYAVVLRGARVVGAGRGAIAALAAGASTQVTIAVIGSIDGHTISITAAPSPSH
jgi:hypothetical protein